MLRFGKHLPLKSLPVDVPRNPYPTAIITLKCSEGPRAAPARPSNWSGRSTLSGPRH